MQFTEFDRFLQSTPLRRLIGCLIDMQLYDPQSMTHILQSMTSNCPQIKTSKNVTIWEHLLKRFHFWTIIKQKKEKKCDNLKCERGHRTV